MSTLLLNKNVRVAVMFVLTFYQDIYLSFLFLFRFCYVDDQLFVQIEVSNTSSICIIFF